MQVQIKINEEEIENKNFSTYDWLYNLGYRDLKGNVLYSEEFDTYRMCLTYIPTYRDILFKVFEHDNPLLRRKKLLERKF